MGIINKMAFKTLVLLIVFVPLIVFSQDKLQQPLPLDPAVKIGKLENGLTYYIRKNGRPEKKVELRLVINAGSILEDEDQQGLAHFTEHMAFNGSKNFKKNDIVSFLQSIGVEFGADLNAYTGFDETVYILPIPTEKKENVEKGFQILEDWASTIAFNAGEIEKERGVVLEEERLGKGADDRIFKVTYPKMFEGSKYSNRLPIGKAEIIKSFKPDVIKRFYKDWYRPNLMAVIVVGDLDPTEAERLIKKHFSNLKNPVKERNRDLATVPPRSKSEGLVVTDKEATNHVVEIYYPYHQVKEEKTVGDYRTYLVEILFRNMLSQRMQELTQKAEPPFVFGASNIGGWARGYEGFNSFAYVSKGGPKPAIEALMQENERARKFGFTAAELERTKKVMLKSIERSFNERDKTESDNLVEEYIHHFLNREPIPGIENEYAYYKEFLENITIEEVNRLTAEKIPADNAPKLVIFTGPDKADFKIPTNEELLRIAEEASKTEVKRYEEKEIATSLIQKAPAPGKIVNESENKELGTTTIKFANDVLVILKPTDYKNDQVVMNASRFGGQYLYDPKERLNAEFASTAITQMGVGQFSPVDLRKVLAGKNASVSPRIGSVSESVSGQCSAVDVETMLQLTYLYFTEPREDAELFNSFVTKQQALYQNMTSDPQYTFQDSVIHILYEDHPWAPKLPTPETFSKIDRHRALAIYKERFGDASGFTFVIVGKFDVEEIKPLLKTYLGSLPSTGKVSSFKDVGLRANKGPIQREVRKGTEPKSFIRIFWNGEAPYSEAEQLKLQALAEVMNIKITETLREDLSGIYGGGMYASLNKYPYSYYSVGLSLPCGPENVNKLIKASMDEIVKVKTKGPSEADLNKVKETWKQQYLVNIKDNAFWARQLLQNRELGIEPSSILTYEKRISAITSNDIKAVANKYLDTTNYVQVVLNPEAHN
ncbi:M16 family metallopeptidase [Chryseosolibacter indicus]|uniref:Insulinase family protein n=1 Tax=Chryseosolibacter indicus TaxID=2782351 RepID=A0ABS5VT87_9BACT|nr:M16 family metallopeptidase [Chryseosolibacter indicus]MBT1704650.1 insulinase family protein [Chryseosolibacter indicus]